MGVLACDRRGCDNVMCDFMSFTYGYICRECLNELEGKAGEVTIAEFMDQARYAVVDESARYTALQTIREEFKDRQE